MTVEADILEDWAAKASIKLGKIIILQQPHM